MKRKVITFTVQIQADMNERPRKKGKVAADLAYDINGILTNHEGMLGGAQILPGVKAIKLATMPED